jgi:hypothetical protein
VALLLSEAACQEPRLEQLAVQPIYRHGTVQPRAQAGPAAPSPLLPVTVPAMVPSTVPLTAGNSIAQSAGGAILINSGNGGGGLSTGGTAAIGGQLSTTSGDGGAATVVGATGNIGGAGGPTAIISGTGGAASGSSTANIGGAGGAITVQGGTGGVGTGTGAAMGAGGVCQIRGGLSGGAGVAGGQILLQTAATTTLATRLTIEALGSVVMGTAALANTATDGFFYLASGAGVPTGVPVAKTGRVPMYYDSTNNKFYIYNGAWRSVALV